MSHTIYGDWRDQRAASEATNKETTRDTDDWQFVETFIKHYAPLKAECVGCKTVMSCNEIYRCGDCHMTFCLNCLRGHFGRNVFRKPQIQTRLQETSINMDWSPQENLPAVKDSKVIINGTPFDKEQLQMLIQVIDDQKAKNG